METGCPFRTSVLVGVRRCSLHPVGDVRVDSASGANTCASHSEAVTSTETPHNSDESDRANYGRSRARLSF